MKFLILGFAKIKYMPYLDFYLNSIDYKKNDIDVIFWNRDLKNDCIPYNNAKFIEFREKLNDDDAKIKKIRSFIRYRNFTKKYLSEKYDRVVVLHTMPGVLNCIKLIFSYKNRFIFDFRDLTFEHFYLFRKIVGLLVKKSKFTSVSSDGFRKYLPNSCKENIVTNHNIVADSLLHRNIGLDKVKSKVIRISFWGYIREENLNCRIISKVAEDNRFELHYYGKENLVTKNLRNYTKKMNASNVFFHGEYAPNDRYDFVKHTDIIHNIYAESENMMLAMGNKFYDGAIFYVPQMCMRGSYMGHIAEHYKIGCSYDPYEDDFLDKIFEYINGIDNGVFISNCDFFLKKCMLDIECIKSRMNS